MVRSYKATLIFGVFAVFLKEETSAQLEPAVIFTDEFVPGGNQAQSGGNGGFVSSFRGSNNNGGFTGNCPQGASYSPDGGCNTCTCLNNGNYACTAKLCFGSSSGSSQGLSNGCSHGQSYSPDGGCNTCTCLNGNYACTGKLCVGSSQGGSSGKLQNEGCKFGPRYSPDGGCNYCDCYDGTYACTNIACGRGFGGKVDKK